MVIAHSEKGVAAGVELVIRHRGLALVDKAAEPWTRLLEQALVAAWPSISLSAIQRTLPSCRHAGLQAGLVVCWQPVRRQRGR